MNTSTTLQRRAPLLAVAVALVLVAMMVTRTSQAAFTATTDNTGNSFTAGTLALTDNAASAMFTVPAMVPGDVETACIEVTYSGTVTNPNAVKLYADPTGFTDTDGLAAYLELTVIEGSGASCGISPIPGTTVVTGSPTVTVDGFVSGTTSYATGVGSWTPTLADATRAYEVQVKLGDAAPNTLQGKATTGVNFVWEVQS